MTATNAAGSSSKQSNTIPWTGDLRQVANRCYLPTLSGVVATTNNRTWHRAAQTLTSLRVVWVNWLGKNEDVTGLGAITLTASVEYPAATFTQIKFAGVNSAVLAVGATITSDAVTVSIPSGATFFIRSHTVNPAAQVFMGNMADPTRGDRYDILATNKVMSGTITTPAASSQLYMPSAIVATTTRDAYVLIGDELCYGSTIPVSGDRGLLAPKVGAAGFGYINMGCPTDTAAGFLQTHIDAYNLVPTFLNSRRIELTRKYCNKIILQLGINDLAPPNNRSDDQVRGDLTNIYKLFAYHVAGPFRQGLDLATLPFSNKNIYLSTMPPVTTSFNGWIDTNGQNPAFYTSQGRVKNNQWRRAAFNGFTGYVEVADAVETGRESNRWSSPGYTADGRAPTATAETVIQNYVPIIGPPAVTTAPSLTGSNVLGGVLTTTDGLWIGEPTITTSHTWLWAKLDASNNPVIDPFGNVVGTKIPNSTAGATFTVSIKDVEKRIVTNAVARNGWGGTRKTSNVTAPVPSPSTATIWDANMTGPALRVEPNGRSLFFNTGTNTPVVSRSLHRSTPNQKIYAEFVIPQEIVYGYAHFIQFIVPEAVVDLETWQNNWANQSPALGCAISLTPLVYQHFMCSDSPDNSIVTIPPFVAGDRVGVAFDTSLTPMKIWFRRNGAAWNEVLDDGSNPATGAGGLRVPLTGTFYIAVDISIPNTETGIIVVANFASTNWIDAPPAGFTQLT